MSIYKSDDDQVIPGVDPIQLIKDSQNARAEKIQQRTGMVFGVAVFGMIALLMLKFANGPYTPYRSSKAFYDTSFLQRFSFMWLTLLMACIPVSMLAGFRIKYPFLFSSKAQTPSILIGAIGLGIVICVAAVFFSRPYSGVKLDRASEGWYFMGGWFLVLWGIVFRK